MGDVTIKLAGSFAVLDGTERSGPGAPVAIGSRKSRRLLAWLAAGHGKVVGVDEIVADLWPQQPPRRPADNVATLVSRLRTTLGPDVVLGGRAGYRLGAPPAVTVDLDQAAGLAAEARHRLAAGEPALAVAAARHGLDLVGDGAVLIGEPAAEWVDGLRSEAATLLRSLRHLLAEAALAAGDLSAAEAVAHVAAGATRSTSARTGC